MRRSLQTILFALLPLALCGPALIACGSDTEPTGAPNEDVDAGEEPDADPSWEQPALVRVELNPSRLAYATGTRITPRATVFDGLNRPISGADITWEVSPAEAVEQQDDEARWFVRQEGRVTFKACVAVDAGEPVCGSTDALVDNTPPDILIESPAPGAQLLAADHPSVEVRGAVTDPNSIVSVHVNGEAVELDGEGRFSATYEPHFGINSVYVTAYDGVQNREGYAQSDFIWAPAYHPTGEDGTLTLEDGLILNLGQNFFDDGQDPEFLSESQVFTDDLADILYLVLRHLDLNSQLPDPVVDSSALVLRVLDVNVNEPRVELDLTDEGLQLFAQIPNLVATTAGGLELNDQSLSLEGDLSASLAIYAEVRIAKNSAEDDFEIELERFDLALERATPNFVSPEVNAVFELANSALRTSLEEMILESVNLSFIDTLPQLLLDLFTSLEDAMAAQSFDLDLGLGEPIALNFAGQISQFTPVHREGLEGVIRAELSTSAEPIFEQSPGVALMSEPSPELPYFLSSRLQLGLNLALINGIFHEVWNAGLLTMDISEMIPAPFNNLVQAARVEGKLPPLIAPPTAGEPYDLMVHLGQLEIELTYPDRVDRFGVRLSVGANMGLQAGEIGLELADEPSIHMWLIDASIGEPQFDANALETLMYEQLWPEIEGAVGEGLSFAVPAPDLSSLGEFSPELSNLQLTLEQSQPLSTRQGFLMVDANFRGELVLP
ncbi:hypothetical protein DL240_13045 [Lujinxingia litoralis]|uniref:Bacterial Ig domain-containing protein n=1 Tax=Lujinxingia litoralis TaxID=2211119 RepID=A0A328C455_9DELT|nr:Ig-like domain-containing protein [Lujinxingia litoralis]RAL21772.1 hypothetical protein DL240_13045 [Lujinxingia litoralis]